MKKLLNNLYITKPDSYVHKERDTIVIKCDGEKLGQFPSLSIKNIFCFGRVLMSPFLMGYCAERGIGIAYFTEYGRFLARLEGPNTGNVLLRREQFRWADDRLKCVLVSKLIVSAKIANSRSMLMRHIRNHGQDPLISEVIQRLASSLKRVKYSQDIEEIRGVEGEAASSYFSGLRNTIRGNIFSFHSRVRRPPTDPVNALLSFIYSLITQECASALQGVGLDPYVGFLHRDRPGRLSLALDILEEFRAAWADRLVMTLVNRNQLKMTDFVKESSGAVRLKEEARKKVLTAYQERKKVELQHPYLEEKVPLGMLPHCQAMLLARHLRADTRYYTPYLVR